MEKYNNKVSLAMESLSQNESLARTVVAAFIAPLDPSIEVLTDVKTAVSEAVTNAVIHGYASDDIESSSKGLIIVELEIVDGELKVGVSDQGAGIEDINQAMEPLYTTKPDMERSGMGFTVMESFMDGIKVHSTPGVGTTVEMVKRLI